MSILFLLIPLSIVAAAGFLAAFIWAVRSGQYEDTCTPSMRVLVDERHGNDPCQAVTAAAPVAISAHSKDSNSTTT